MTDEATPRQLRERTGRHLCIICLGEVAADEFFANDHICAACADKDEYPFASKKDEIEQKEESRQ